MSMRVLTTVETCACVCVPETHKSDNLTTILLFCQVEEASCSTTAPARCHVFLK